MLKADSEQRPFDWVEQITKELAVLINCSLEEKATN